MPGSRRRSVRPVPRSRPRGSLRPGPRSPAARTRPAWDRGARRAGGSRRARAARAREDSRPPRPGLERRARERLRVALSVPLGFLRVSQLDEDGVGHDVPGVVDAAEEQQQDRGRHAEERLALVGRSRERREREQGIGCERQQGVEQPVLELRPVLLLPAHAQVNHRNVRDPNEADETPCRREGADAVPRNPENGRQQQHRAEMNDGRRQVRRAAFRRGQLRLLGDQRQDDELQTDQGAGRRADDDVEALPLDDLVQHAGPPGWMRRISYLYRSKRYASSGPPFVSYASCAMSIVKGSVCRAMRSGPASTGSKPASRISLAATFLLLRSSPQYTRLGRLALRLSS